MYLDLLGRTVEPAGLTGWLIFLGDGGTLAEMKVLILGASGTCGSHPADDPDRR